MPEMIAHCGIDCETCPALIATRQNDLELRRKTAVEWSKSFGHEFKPEEINCTGCTSTGSHIGYCETMCEIRKCSRSRQLVNCAFCPDYACPTLEAFQKNVPEARARLEKVRAGRKSE
jgi:hypothetical protein